MDSLLQKYNLEDKDCRVEITDCHLQEISSNLCEDWRSLPAYLEMEVIVVSDIDRKQVDESEKRHDFLLKWKNVKGSEATYKKLVAALLARKCRGDAEKVCRLLQKCSKASTIDSTNNKNSDDVNHIDEHNTKVKTMGKKSFCEHYC